MFLLQSLIPDSSLKANQPCRWQGQLYWPSSEVNSQNQVRIWVKSSLLLSPGTFDDMKSFSVYIETEQPFTSKTYLWSYTEYGSFKQLAVICEDQFLILVGSLHRSLVILPSFWTSPSSILVVLPWSPCCTTWLDLPCTLIFPSLDGWLPNPPIEPWFSFWVEGH